MISLLETHADQKWDVLVIGGGATGLGTALDAVTRGYSTILIEKSDFAGGTSSRSTKLVHGGVRYLAQGDVFLVMEALRERGRMLRNAPHISSNQEFIIPAYTWFDVILYTVGLKFYDILAGRLSLGKSYFISKKTVLERLPNIREKGLKGGIVYHDGQFDDSRMAISLARACAEKGGVVLNYFRVEELRKDVNGRITGVSVSDSVSGKNYEINACCIINATGVFADDILRLDNPLAHQIIKPSQGIHLVLDHSFLRGNSAIMIPKTEDGRVLFAIPWYGRVVTGTTDTPLENISENPVALDSEVEFILRTASLYMVKPPSKEDILSVFAGLRPLASDPYNPKSTKEISRRHKIIVSCSGLVTVTGGKWTTYRCMAEETIDRAIKEGLLNKSTCVTKNYLIGKPEDRITTGRLKIYGSGAGDIEKMMKDLPGSANNISGKFPYTFAEISWICRNEMPCTLEDMLSRRTRALLLDARESLEIAPAVAKIMAEEMRRDDAWVIDQVEKFAILVKNHLK